MRLVRENDKEARALIEAIQDANMRSYAYSEASAALPDTERARKLELLNESLVAGRAVADPEARVLRLADIGGRLFDLGQTERSDESGPRRRRRPPSSSARWVPAPGHGDGWPRSWRRSTFPLP